jgi:hypothetical protein
MRIHREWTVFAVTEGCQDLGVRTIALEYIGIGLKSKRLGAPSSCVWCPPLYWSSLSGEGAIAPRRAQSRESITPKSRRSFLPYTTGSMLRERKTWTMNKNWRLRELCVITHKMPGVQEYEKEWVSCPFICRTLIVHRIFIDIRTCGECDWR